MKQAEVRKNGYKALIDSLGIVGMLRFLQQLEIGSGDYTLDRHQASEPTIEEFRQFINNTVSAKSHQLRHLIHTPLRQAIHTNFGT